MRIPPVGRYFGHVYIAAASKTIEPVAAVAKTQLAPSNPGHDAVVLAQSLLDLIEKQKHEKRN